MSVSKAEIERLRKRVEILETRADNLLRNAGYDVPKSPSEASEEVMELLLTGNRTGAKGLQKTDRRKSEGREGVRGITETMIS